MLDEVKDKWMDTVEDTDSWMNKLEDEGTINPPQ